MPSVFKIFLLAMISFGVDLDLSARETPPVDPASSDDDLRMRGVFESDLPNTEKKHSIKLTLHPHFGDLHRYDYMRVPIGLRYGISDSWEISAETETYFAHGLGGDSGGTSIGVSGYRISSKLHKQLFQGYDWDQVEGVEYTSPFSDPPAQITDGMSHLRGYMNFARYLDTDRKLRIFWGLGVDFVGATRFEGTLKENAIGDNSNEVTVGCVWERKNLTYTLESMYATSRFLGDNDRDLYAIRPGILWKVPTKYTFNSRGNWVLGCAFKLSDGEDGFDFGLSLKVKLNFKFKD